MKLLISLIGTTLLAVLFGAQAVAQEDQVDFATQIQPLLVERCGACHGEKKKLGRLRLHSAVAIKEKLESEPNLLVTGKPDQSELYQRLVLPADDKKRMPKKADALPETEIALIRRWIEQGAALAGDVDQPATAAAPAESPSANPFPEVSPAESVAIDGLVAAGAQVQALFAESPLLEVSFARREEPAGDAELALLKGVAEQVVSLNLADARATDSGYESLAALRNLRRLHLERSTISDDALSHASGLAALEYLNLYGTGITDVGLGHLKELPYLKKLYLWQTKVSYDAAMSLGSDQLSVSLGYDHPVVARKRTEKLVKQLREQVKVAEADEEAAQKQLNHIQRRKETLATRLAELEKSLAPNEPAADQEGEEESGGEEGHAPAEDADDKPAEDDAK